MPYLIVSLLLCLCMVNSKYQIIGNQASENIFISDRHDGPVVGPTPHTINHGNETLYFDECAFEIEKSEITMIYLDVIFGKEHLERWKEKSREEIANFTAGGKKIITVKLPTNHKNPDIPTGFDTKYEEYSLEINGNGQVFIQASFYPGTVRALDTLSQLIVKDEKSNGIYTIEYAPFNIEDKPSYPYRGVMIDTAREFFFPDTIEQVIDGMMLGKLNVLHWHFSDDDSFPMYSESYPDLTDYTSFSKEEIYKPDTVKKIVKYGKIRGIRVVPELEGPGHMNVLGFYPKFKDLIAWFRNSSIVEKNANGGPPPAPINPVNDTTYEFLEKFMNDMAKNFDTEIWHLGGDEVGQECWQSIHEVKEYMNETKSSLTDLQELYIQKERELLTGINQNAKAIYWYQSNKLHYDKDDILQLWDNISKIKTQINEHPDNYFILSPSDYYYLDCGYPSALADKLIWGQMRSYNTIFNLDPSVYDDYSNGKLLGSEVCAWSEMNNEFDMLTKLFPRAGAMSFRNWNPKESYSSGHVIEMLMRYQYRVKGYGIPTEKISMRYWEKHTHHCFGL